MEAEQVLTLENRREAMAGLADEFDCFCQRHGLAAKISYPFQVALDELLTNTIEYGYPDQSARTIEVHLRLMAECLDVELIDDARPFNPFQREAPDTEASIEDRQIGGLGIHLVVNLMDRVDYTRIGAFNHICLRKYLTAQSANKGQT